MAEQRFLGQWERLEAHDTEINRLEGQNFCMPPNLLCRGDLDLYFQSNHWKSSIFAQKKQQSVM